MKSLLCSLNTKFVHSSLAVWCLKASVENRYPNLECDVLEGTINEPEQAILDRILEKSFDLIGFSTYIWNFSRVISLCEKIKLCKNVKIVLGGPEVSYNARNILEKYNFIDYVISGEGEHPFSEICAGKNAENIAGLCYRNGNKIVVKEPYLTNEEPSSPYCKEYFDTLNGRIAYIETSRGCPYRCAFCLSGRCGGVRFFDIQRAKKEIIALANSGAKTIKFIDRTFNADKARAKEIFEFIISSVGKEIPEGVCFHFEIEGDILDDSIMSTLEKAEKGIIQMEIGLQSFNPKTLEAINRKTNMAKLCSNVTRLISMGNIHVHLDLIAGLPYEDLSSFGESFNKALSLKPHMLQFGFLKMLYGTKLRDESSSYLCEYSDTPPYEIISTKWLSENDLTLMHDIEDCFERVYNSGRFPRLTNYIFDTVENAFDFYTGLAVFVKENEKEKTLDGFSKLVYDYMCSDARFDADMIRDLMAMDRLSTNRMGFLPEFLKIHSPKLKELLNLLDENPNTKRRNGTKRAITLLKTESAFVYVDYDCKNPVTNQYELTKYII